MNQTAGYVLVGLATVLASVVVGFLARRSGKDSAVNDFTKNLLARLDSVEDQLDEVKTQLTRSQQATIAAVRFIDRLVDWGRRGGKEAMPTPSPELHEYLDPTMWQQAQGGPEA